MKPAPLSWGRRPRVAHSRVTPLYWRQDPLPSDPAIPHWLPFGNGRSYGDVCLNAQGGLWLTRNLRRFIAWDPERGVLRCEAGVLLAEILRLCVPQGWFLPVTPGTQWVTVGGAIANDVHGKNHHVAGTFSHHVRAFELLRSDGSRLICSATENPQWFAATVGGLGLTGLITWGEIQLQRIASPWINVTYHRFRDLEEYFALQPAIDADYPYSVAWVDCLAAGPQLGRGILMAGHHAGPLVAGKHGPGRGPRPFPFNPPVSLVNRLTLRAFNALYYHRSLPERRIEHYSQFFYPLDAVLEWNRIYGRRGFNQYQCVLPPASAPDAMREILARIAHARQGSFLAVLKTFGSLPSKGLLSFPQPGLTIALDFPWLGDRTQRLFEALDEVTRQAGGRLYPAKDAAMTGELFRATYPAWERFAGFMDPACSSSFWRRVMT